MSSCGTCGASYADNISHCPYCSTPRPKDPTIRVEVVHPEKKAAPNACPICQRADHTRRVSAIVNQQIRRTNGRTEHKEVKNHQNKQERTDAQGRRVVEATESTVRAFSTTGTSTEEKTYLAELLQCPDFAPPSAFGKFGKVVFGESKWRDYRVRVRGWLARLQPMIGAAVGAASGIALAVALLAILHLDYDSDPLLNDTALGYLIGLAMWGAAFLFGWAGYALLRFLAPKWQHAYESRIHEEGLSGPAREIWAQLYYCEQDDVIYLPGQKRSASPRDLREFCLSAASKEQRKVIDAPISERATQRW